MRAKRIRLPLTGGKRARLNLKVPKGMRVSVKTRIAGRIRPAKRIK